MSFGRRITLLAVLIFLISSPAATACGLLCPLYWLFGCQHIHPGYAGAYGNAYQNEPYASWKVIDDWLGYGYLRNQNGTLGHYPGNWYRNLHHGYRQPQPALAWQPQFNGGYPAPAAPQQIYAPAWDPCCDPCGSMPPLAIMPQPQYAQPQYTQPQYYPPQYPQPQFYQPQPWMQTAPMMAGTMLGRLCRRISRLHHTAGLARHHDVPLRNTTAVESRICCCPCCQYLASRTTLVAAAELAADTHLDRHCHCPLSEPADDAKLTHAEYLDKHFCSVPATAAAVCSATVSTAQYGTNAGTCSFSQCQFE